MSVTISGHLVQQLRGDLNQALAAVTQKYGITFNVGRMLYSPTEGTVRFRVEGASSSGANNQATDIELNQFRNYATSLFGVPQDALTLPLTINGEKFMLTGLRKSRHKFPFSAKRVGGNRIFKLTANSVRNAYAEAKRQAGR